MKEEADRFYLKKQELTQLPDKSGVYFLFQENGALVYIGMAVSLRRRVPQHIWDKEFSYMEYEPCHRSRVRDLEGKYLDLYKEEHGGELPYYNKQI